MVIEKRVGDKLELTLQLHDGLDTFPNRVFVDLIDANGTIIKSDIELAHLSCGLFRESSETMPNVQTLFAQFKVKKADGEMQSVDHSDETDRYERQIPVDLPDAIIPKPFAIKVITRSVRAKVKVRPNNRIKIGVRNE